ncbi:MAG: transporter substrate-binding domain-containing protein [Oscillospiraceae bacterium]|jgi:ABC-type amino acid transport substrate-binding protein
MNKCKKIITAALSAAMLLSLAACGGKTSETSPSADVSAAAFKTVTAGELHMATNAEFPPYEMVKDGSTTEYEGIDVEIAQKIAEKLGLKLVVDNMDFSSVVTSVQTGKEDIAMAGLTVTDERKNSIDFTDSYATGKQVIIVKEGSDIKSAADLKGKKIGCQEATTGYFYCSAPEEEDGYGEENVTAYTNGALAVQALTDGKVDAVVIDNEPAKNYVASTSGLKILETPFISEDYAIGVSKENTALRDAINAVLKELIEDGTVKAIIDKYIAA